MPAGIENRQATSPATVVEYLIFNVFFQNPDCVVLFT